MRSRAAFVLGAIVAALLAWLLLWERPAHAPVPAPEPPAQPAPARPVESAASISQSAPTPPPSTATTAPGETPIDDGLVPLRGTVVVHGTDAGEVPAPRARLVLVEGDVVFDGATGRLRGEREIIAGADGRFEARVRAGADLHLYPSPADARWVFPAGIGRQVPPPGSDLSSGAFRVLVVAKGRVSGIVFDPDGSPLSGAEVVLSYASPDWSVRAAPGPGESATTDSEGRYALTGVTPGAEAAVLAKKRPFRKSLSGPIRVEPGGAVDRVVVRMSRGAHLEGAVQDSDGNPIADARLRLTTGNTTHPAGPTLPAFHPEPETSDSRGRYRFDGLEERSWRVFADAPGFLPGEIERIEVGPEGAEAPPIVLRKGSVFRGRVVDEAGAAIAGAALSLHAEAGGGGTTTSAADGRFESLAAPGTAKLYAGKLGYASWQPRDVAVPQETEFVVVLASGFALEGSVLDLDGRPVGKAQIFVNGIPFGGRSDAIVTADAEGRFRIPGLGPEPCVLRVHAEGHVFPDFRDVSPPTTGVLLRAVRATALAGTVVRDDGTRCAGAFVAVRAKTGAPEDAYAKDTRWSQSGTADESGEFRFEGLLGETFDVHATAGGGGKGRADAVPAGSESIRIVVQTPR